jgi:hypothetical protein
MQLPVMNQKPVSIPKKPVLRPALDFYRLRKEGIGFVEQMGSRQWTDYNTHDPGITILESLCYAITDLAYRSGRDIKDILTPAIPTGNPSQPYKNQSFFTAREILTVNPWTTDDFRRILTDSQSIRNAWLFFRDCACDAEYYAWCEEDQLHLSYTPPVNPNPEVMKVSPLGLYDAMLELESHPETGDLNDRKIERSFMIRDAGGNPHGVVTELRFPEWDLSRSDEWKLFLGQDAAFAGSGGESFSLKLKRLGATKTYNVLTDPALDEDGRNRYLRGQWRNVLYADLEIRFAPGGKKILIPQISIRLFSDNEARNAASIKFVTDLLTDSGAGGLLQLYRRKVKKAIENIREAGEILRTHRNLSEDFCRIGGIRTDDIGICADIEVTPEADIDRVQARIWFETENYLNPPVPFYSLREMLDAGIASEEIFNGPILSSGFIRQDDLSESGLRTVLRTSDLVNILMEIEGVVAVNSVQLVRYDDEGNPVKGCSDPNWVDGLPDFDPSRTSASWLLYLRRQHLPRLYRNVSRFHFYKNGLPFIPRLDEVKDTLTQLRGEADRPRFSTEAFDLPVPAGEYSDFSDYFPISYMLPPTYGINPDGLPENSSAARKASARQLKAYLLVYEQLLGNAFAQISGVPELFSLDPAVDRTYFVKAFTEELIAGYDEITTGLSSGALGTMAENENEFRERRNRFMNHLLARFGEQFSEYALLLTDLEGKSRAQETLIHGKIAFLRSYPVISRERAKAFDYSKTTFNPGNSSGISRRVSLLLGFPELSFAPEASEKSPGLWSVDYKLNDFFPKTVLSGSLEVSAASGDQASELAYSQVICQMMQPESYKISGSSPSFHLRLLDTGSSVIGKFEAEYGSAAEARDAVSHFVAWAANERSLVIEHLLLRPKFPGDALFPVCSDGPCTRCGDEDPYSFRLTWMMPGWTYPFSTNMDMRRFAERTVRQEVPAHLLAKICWVGNDGFVDNACDPVMESLTALLSSKGRTTGGELLSSREACDSALSLYNTFSLVFAEWYHDKTLLFLHSDAVVTALDAVFSLVKPDHFTLPVVLTDALWQAVNDQLKVYFLDTALYGWQFERFENAWYAWLKVNAAIDWSQENLHAQVEAILRSGLRTGSDTTEDELCACADGILERQGEAFRRWMDECFAKAFTPGQMQPYNPPKPGVCSGNSFQTGTLAAVHQLLTEKYRQYTSVSYHLKIVVELLARLRNTYPGATLHDCDDGSDQNPLRLGSTALGNYTLNRRLDP